jgi:hypothetical protein
MMSKDSQAKSENNLRAPFVKETILAMKASLRNTTGRRLVERHAPELTAWLNELLDFTPPAPKSILPKITIIEDAVAQLSRLPAKPIQPRITSIEDYKVQIDPELSRIAYLLGFFPGYRAWLYASRRIGDGGGWVNKADFDAGLKRFRIELHQRSLDRYIEQGRRIFWSYDRKTKRVYLRSAEKVAASLTRLLLNSAYAASFETNKPGVRRVLVDLSGSIGQAAANAYAAWFAAKNNEKGTIISRDTLMALWAVSVPTMLEWEKQAGISKAANYAQQADSSIESVPQHARLVRGRAGQLFVTWQLPNTYYAPKSITIHEHLGNAQAVRDAVLEASLTKQPAIARGWGSRNADLNHGGSPRLGKLYFETVIKYRKGAPQKLDGFSLVQRTLKRDKAVFKPRYVFLGKKGRVGLFERYNILSNVQETSLWQREKQANLDAEFERQQAAYTVALNDCF